MDEEISILEMLSLASAVKNRGGTVICQVKRLVPTGSLHPKAVKVPGHLIDYIVPVTDVKYHMQTQQTEYNPAFAGDLKVPTGQIVPLPLDERKVVVRRAAQELNPGALINLGLGMPMGIASVVAEAGNVDDMTLTTELGSFGGTPAGGLDFGACYNAEAMIEHGAMFDLYDGGALDTAFLGMAQVDRYGNVNVSKLGNMLNGPGGVINISQNTKNIVFCGTFTSGADIRVQNGMLEILKEGRTNKFVKQVTQITFSGQYAMETNQNVLFITERCVFKLQNQTLALIEIAPGIDLQTQILDLMPFVPKLAPKLEQMDASLFKE
jgi:propionate CoA-transferase